MRIELRNPYKQFFGTLANQYRLDIIESLRDDPKSVSEICKKIKRVQSTVSHSLRRLEEWGFVSVKPNEKERVYSLNQETIKPLLTLMHTYMNIYRKRLCE